LTCPRHSDLLKQTQSQIIEAWLTASNPSKSTHGSVLFGSLDPGEKTLEPGPLSWVAVKNKYFVLGILSPTNGTLFSEVTLTGGPRTSKDATNAAATAVEAIENNSFAFEIYAGPSGVSAASADGPGL